VSSGFVSLTFDDGPSQWTGAILEALAVVDARATFFVVGRWINEVPGGADLLRRMHEDGHEVGNHTFDHYPQLTERTDQDVRDQLERTSDLIEAYGLPRPMVVRAPALGYDERVLRVAAHPDLGFEWMVDRTADCDARDWWRDEVTSDDIVRVVSTAEPGAIVLLHDGPPPERAHENCQSTVDALPRILEQLTAASIESVTVSRLIELDESGLQLGSKRV
jgi:peptidoglycan/xylan/chitin deacetylase (PgdA/CDA1 family)